MTHVLRMAALEVGHPIGVLVLMEADNLLFHRQHLSRGLFARLARGGPFEHGLLFRRFGGAVDFVRAE